MPINKDFIEAVNNHVSTLESQEGGGTGGTTKEPEAKTFTHNSTQQDYDLDVRDIITDFVGKGKDLKGADQASLIARLGVVLGKPNAQKLVTHLFLFNNRDDVKGKNVDQKLDSLYAIGSTDKYVNDLLAHTKSLAYGPHEGLQTSVDVINKELAGKKPPDNAKQDQSKTVEALAAKAVPQ